MASGSPRTRIDQFYAARKRKKASPGRKSEKVDEGSIVTAGGSPLAKGTLDNYLVKSSHNDSYRESGLSSRQDRIKRNLALETNSTSESENKNESLGAQEPAQARESLGKAYEGTSFLSSGMVDLANEAVAQDVVPSAMSIDDPERKKFAAEFLSLYCSELPASVSLPSERKLSGQKRDASPSSSCVEGETGKKKKGILVHDKSPLGSVVPCSNAESLENATPKSSAKPREENLRDTVGLDEASGETKSHARLRKCNNTATSNLDVGGCHTPCSSIIKVATLKTPQSARGSSIFSPGEAFWDEAIQLADGLFAPIDKFSVNAVKELGVVKVQCEQKNSSILESGRSKNKLREIVDEDGSGAKHMELKDSLGSLERHENRCVDSLPVSSDKEVSPLPVRHFDFLAEENSSGKKNFRQWSTRDERNSKLGRQQLDSDVETHTAPQAADIELCYNPEGKLGSPVLGSSNKDRMVFSSNDGGEIHLKESGSSSVMAEKTGVSSYRYNDTNTVNMEEKDIRSPLATDRAVDGVCTPSSSLLLRESLELASWLPSELCSIYMKRGISKLYPWQVSCLRVDGVLEKRNLVYCASTSAGKSFVAEILMLRRVLSTGKIAILVLPYVSICAEKAEHLERLLQPLGKDVRSFYGNQGGGTLPKDTSVAVCTIEKANFLVNRLLEEGRLSEVGIIVIDELHMVGDQHRGYLLELMLTKLRYASGEGNVETSSEEGSGASNGKVDSCHGLQMVGMSATMPNVSAVADWLQAALYQTDFRPVPLEEFIKIGNSIYNKNMELVRTLPKTTDLRGKDPDHIVELCNEVVQEGHSVLLFCSSRKGCESTARHVAKFIKRFSVSSHHENEEFGDISSAIDALQRCPVGLDPTLQETLPAGVAYHHAGLTVEEREIIETCYRKGLVRVLTATSTLAAGVNLPARRVIFRQPRIGRDFIDGTRYKQMAGRAGRTGIDTKGESVLVCRAEEVKKVASVINDSCPPLQSCLSEDKNGMTHAILEVVAGGLVQTAGDIHRYVRCTLLNSTKPFQDVVKSAQDSLRWLCQKKFLEWNEETKLYSATPLGRAAFGSSLNPEESLVVLDDLSRAREGFVLASDLHLVYLVTPINVDVEPDWELYYERFMELSTLEQSVGNRVGVDEPFLMRMAHGAPVHVSTKLREIKKGHHQKLQSLNLNRNSIHSDDQTLRVCKRFYVALILSRLVQEVPVTDVCDAFKVARGMVQALQENAGRFASMVSLFCERLGWHDVEGLVAKFQNRVSFGVRAEIAELTTIPYVKGSRARALYKAGFRTHLAIAEATTCELAKALFESSSWHENGSAQRHMQLSIAKKIKNGARKIVLEKAEEARIAAFSTFKSLGIVPQLLQPLVLSDVKNPHLQEGAVVSSSEETVCRIVGEEPINLVEDNLAECENGNSSRVEPQVDDGTATKMSDFVSGTSGKTNSVVALQCVNETDNLETLCEAGNSGDRQAENPGSGQAGNSGVLSFSVSGTADNDKKTDGNIDQKSLQENPSIEIERLNNNCNAHNKGPVNANSLSGGVDSFLDLWDTVEEFYFDIHFSKRLELNSIIPFEIHGIAICWENSPVYYVNLAKDLVFSGQLNVDVKHRGLSLSSVDVGSDIIMSKDVLQLAEYRWNKIANIMSRGNVRKFSWNLKVQIQVFKKPGVSIRRFGGLSIIQKNAEIEMVENSHFLLPPIHVQNGCDMCIIAWLLWPDEERSSKPNIEKEVRKRLSSDVAAAANQSGRWRNQIRRAAHDGCCRRVAQTRALGSVLWKLVASEKLDQALISIENPLVNVLADMELWGIGVDMEGCLQARHVVWKKLKELEKEAHQLAGMTFSLSSSADIADVLYRQLKLPVPDVGTKGKQHPSTDKHSLDLLRHQHPIISVIKEYRSLAKLSNCTLGSMCSLAKICMRSQKYKLHGHWLQTSTATGRLSMEEPNLQCVEHTITFKVNHTDKSESVDHQIINARDFFIPTQDNWLLLTADYSQIELRLMAHFSKDPSLIQILAEPNGDVFTMIGARWTGQLQSTVNSHERDQTKRLVYGILYGMGPGTLAQQLDCSIDEASDKIKSFKSTFPGVALWLKEVVELCRQKGYIETLMGRKRFLSKIKFGNSEEKGKARRQAVNSICQGSAADIIKIAMINIHSVIDEGQRKSNSSVCSTRFSMLKGHFRLLLQVHDELVLEVDPSVTRDVASLLQYSMENAVSLLVPLHVKLKVGRTWGSLEPYIVEQ
ncbi:hypothetical protein Syun_011894 [Stephania yunnanensis]|uniref:DNA-directed DNA polymerase n=1 Tax=Stephania yunnanensis TaxID=152371 RepID=A0AAP0PGZ0_9MAGN